MYESILTKKINEYVITIFNDDEPYDPREAGENISTMLCAHRNYNLGDENILKNFNPDDYDGWESLEAAIKKDNGFVATLPLYLYDHSGITMSTEPFSCQFDSGRVGVIGITRDSMKENFGWKRVTPDHLEKLKEALIIDVKEYDRYLSGEAYGYDIKKDDESIDSCRGFYMSPEELMEEVIQNNEYILSQDVKIDIG